MRLTDEQKNENVLNRILEINRECFNGVQRAPDIEVLRAIRRGELFVFIDLGEVIGFAICEAWGAVEVQLWSLAVKKERRGHNFGGMLLDEARQFYEELGGYDVMSLNVHVDNIPAIHLYERLGFRKVATLKRWFLQDGDGIRMVKELS